MKKIYLLTALLALAAFGAVLAKNTRQPDFAFPNKVADESIQSLDSAIHSGDGKNVVRSLINYSLARNEISPDYLPAAIAKVDSVASAESDVATRSLLRLLEAEMFMGIYGSDMWKYNRREVPMEPLPDDCFEWSGDQFRARISSLLADATAASDTLVTVPLADWSDIVTTSRESLTLYPTLFDFIAYRAIDTYSRMNSSPGDMPARYMTIGRYLEPLPEAARISEPSRRIQELYRLLVELHPDAPAPRILAEVNAAKFMASGSYSKRNRLILDIYLRNRQSPWSGLALEEYSGTTDSTYTLLKEFIATSPDYYNINAIRNKIARLTTPGVDITYPSIIPPDKPVDMKLSVSNVKEYTLKFKHIATGKQFPFTISFDKTVPYRTDTTLTITLPLSGEYTLHGAINGKLKKETYYNRIRVSSLQALTFSTDSKAYFYAVDSDTGAPVEGVDVGLRTTNKKKYKSIGKTDVDGAIARTLASEYWISYSLLMTAGKDSTELRFSTYRQTDYKPYVTAELFTDISLYHPGDTARWALVVYESFPAKYERKPAENITFDVSLYDANYNKVHTLTVTTDSSGRATGVFVLPKDGVSGRYEINAAPNHKTTRDEAFNNAYTSFMVNDYKLPTFTVERTDIRRSTEADSAVTVTFCAKTYSGFPVAGAEVVLDLGQTHSFWYSASYADDFWSTTAITDSNGEVILTLPASVFDLAPDDTPYYRLRATVTSPAGETQKADATFSLGKPYIIRLGYLPASINLDNKPVITAETFDFKGDKTTSPQLVASLRAKDEKSSIPIRLGEPLPAKLKAGIYTLEVAPADTTLADSETREITLYRSTGSCPFENLTVPLNSMNATGGKASVIYGNPHPDAHLLVIQITDSVITSRQWIKPGAGMHTFDVTIAPDAREVKVYFTTYHKFKTEKAEIRITNPDFEQQLRIETETFRDKVVPGNKETVSLLFKDKNDQPVPAYALLGMSSAALNDLSHNQWYLYTGGWTFPTCRLSSSVQSEHMWIADQPNRLSAIYITQPVFNLYDHSFGVSNSRRYINVRGIADKSSNDISLPQSASNTYLSSSDNIYSQDEVITEEEAEAEPGDELNTIMQTETTFMALEGSVAGVAITANGGDDADAGIYPDTATDTFKYRPTEIPLAFFEPMLASDSDGRLTYEYTVPDANTSWIFQGVAYTTDLSTDRIQRTVVASRPVMVQSNLPRFLRYGDETSIRATVMNQTDTAMQTLTTVTILDAATMQTLLSQTYTDTITPRGSVTVATDYTVPAGECQAIVYRVKTSAGAYTDGEQDIIPLLPPTQPVITSTPFFVPADTDEASIDIPAAPAGATSTLYLYDNPLWEVITALPSIADGDATTSVSAAELLYKSAVGRGLMSDYPAVRNGLAEWLSSDRADSTLVSMLERNDDLKQLTLNATPWARDAMSDRQRLDALALILDETNTSKAIDNAIRTLQNLSQADGGLAWAPGFDRSSEWATDIFLDHVTWLSIRGYLPDDERLAKIIDGAVGFVDAKAAERFKKYGDRTDFTDYVFLRSMLPGVKATPTTDRIVKLTIQKILSRWKDESVMAKVFDAVILYHNGYPTMARKLTESIASFSISSPEKGRWWAGLDPGQIAGILMTFETVATANRDVIDGIAQWLILAKTAQNWGNSATTAAAVEAIIGAIPAEKAATATTSVTLNGTLVANDTPQLPGMTVSDISSRLNTGSNTLTIAKSTGLPAMGSVISRSVQAMDSIEAHAVPAVSIRKRLNLVTPEGVVAADTLHVGDRVRVQLIITATERLDYITVIDRNAACMEPAQQLSGYRFQDRLWFYRETKDTENRMFIELIEPGTYIVDYEMYITATGKYSSGVATLQSQLNPAIDANSSARRIVVTPK